MHMGSGGISEWGVFLALAFGAGCVHMLAPDHWVPASILSWQRRWNWVDALKAGSVLYLAHLFFGLGIFATFSRIMSRIPDDRLFVFGFVLVSVVAVVRAMRFGRIREVLRSGSGGFWGLAAVFSLLGPCEVIIPVLVKANHLGMGYLPPFLAFGAGTTLMGVVMTQSGHRLWGQPMWLPRGISWLQERSKMIPLSAGIAMGITLLLRIS